MAEQAGSNVSELANKLWGFCNILRHDGVDYGDYIEQLTYLLFIKMADERSLELPPRCTWAHLLQQDEQDLINVYNACLRSLVDSPGVLGEVFSGASNKVSNPSSLMKLLHLIDQVNWSKLGVDVQAAVFEGLLERAAAEGKKGAGQYFTPRPLIESVVRCVKPGLNGLDDYQVCDPATGTGGFLVAAVEWAKAHASKHEVDAAPLAFHGTELVQRPRRLALMNLFLHGVQAHIQLRDAIYSPLPAERFDVVLTNPPFGTKGAAERPARDDFPIATNNKQINFLQHIVSILKDGGRAAVVVPDNVLFGAQAQTLFKSLTTTCNLHTILRCPDGTFSPYTEGTRTNVLFFTKGPSTRSTWIYDARAGVPKINKRSRKLLDDTFHSFERCFGSDPDGNNRGAHVHKRWREFAIDEIIDAEYQFASFRWLDLARELTTDDPLAQIGAALDNVDRAAKHLRSLERLLRTEERNDQR